MKVLEMILVVFVAIQHFLFLVLEMFLWETPYGLKTFNMTAEVASASATLAKNQGLYNGFLAAGLIWAVFLISNTSHRLSTLYFFLICIIVAAIFGGITAKPSILFVQGIPALLAMIVLYFNSTKK
ncbi:MAG: DUF1304 domain-containing protein [Leptospira sp.]|nr:DUF1304 domain-containing protein [Leptospira sp.]NCS92979.1 DUF1304 domain-containing protein [Leptospira sp.]